MKKIYFIIVSIGVIIFIYWIATTLPTFSAKIVTVTSDTLNNSTFSSTGSFGFKSTNERKDLTTQMININSKFIKDPPIEIPATSKNKIKNFYKLENFFPEFKDYYIAKLKIKNTLFTELPNLYNNTSSLSDSELKVYFDNNTTYLEEKWGINDFNELSNIVSDIKQTNGKKVSSCELEDSYFYIEDLDILNFRIILTLEDSSITYIGAKAYIYENNDYQSSPIIRFFSASGGTSYV